MRYGLLLILSFPLALHAQQSGTERLSQGIHAPSSTALSASQVQVRKAEILEEWQREERTKLAHNEAEKCITQDNLQMPYYYNVHGEKPADGRSLYISMHGGGNAPKSLNDSQWENQKNLYAPAEGIYLSPRAPWDDWNMWFQAPIDALFEELIRTMIVCCDVNPDKVYLMGYSAGGDGVWRLAPRLADHWAAASMMAGHPGDVGLLNVLNMPFTLWVGARDVAYDRNKEVAARGLELDSLQQAMPHGYVHECHVVAGMPHWMNLRDAAALPWMAQYRRQAHPRHIIWQQEEVLRPCFYWLQVPQNEMKRGNKVEARIKGNTIQILHCDYSEITLFLDDDMLNLDKKVTVLYQGHKIFSGKLTRTDENLRSTLSQRGDPSYMFPAQVKVKL